MADEHTPDADEAAHDAHSAGKDDHKPKGGKLGPDGKPIKDAKKDRRNTVVLIALTAAGVVIGFLALRKSNSSGSSSAAAGSPVGSSALNGANYPSDGSSGSAAGGSDGTDSNGILDYLQSIQSQLATSTGTSSTVSTSPYGPYSGHGFDLADGAHLKYYKNLTTGAAYQILPDGSSYKLSGNELAELHALYGNAVSYAYTYGKAPVKSTGGTKSGKPIKSGKPGKTAPPPGSSTEKPVSGGVHWTGNVPT